MGFYFKFQKLLEIEILREEGIVKELKIIQKQLHDEEKLLGFLESVLTLQQSEMEKILRGEVETRIFILYEEYLKKLNRDIAFQRSKIQEVVKKVDQIREKLLAVYKRRKVLEKLRERCEKEYKEHILRLENKKFDEVATSRFIQKRTGDIHE